MENFDEQELLHQLCIIAVMQKEGLSDSRNRQASETKRAQNEDQIWQRVAPCKARIEGFPRTRRHCVM
jgi:hypothetical protein